MPEMPVNIVGKLRSRRVSSRPVLLESLHRDPVQVSTHEPAQRLRLGSAMPGNVGELITQGAQAS